MKEWLKRLFHHHQWCIYREAPLTIINEDGQKVGMGRRFILQCSECGTIKQKDIE